MQSKQYMWRLFSQDLYTYRLSHRVDDLDEAKLVAMVGGREPFVIFQTVIECVDDKLDLGKARTPGVA
jgi:hypothetical protein